MSSESPGIPDGVAWLWRTEPERAPREALSAERIVQAAVELADAEGLDAVSMARVAERLGAGTMSLYRHVSNKDELLLLMHDSAWQQHQDPNPPDLSRGWRPALEEWCRRQRATFASHPWLERIRFVERAGTPSQLVTLERGLAILDGTALPEADKVALLMLLNGFLLQTARYDEEMRTAATALGVSPELVAGRFGELMRALTTDGQFPAMARAVEGDAFAPGSATVGDFEWGLAVILDGAERLTPHAPHPRRAHPY